MEKQKTVEELIDIFIDDLLKPPKSSFSNKDRFLKDWLLSLITSESEKREKEVEVLKKEFGYTNCPVCGIKL